MAEINVLQGDAITKAGGNRAYDRVWVGQGGINIQVHMYMIQLSRWNH